MVMKPEELLALILQSFDVARIGHWSTLSYAEHKTLNAYYDGIVDLTDSLVESYFGVIGKRLPLTVPASSLTPVRPYFLSLRKAILENRSSFGTENTEIQNILDEILGLIDDTLYLLTLS